MDDDQHLRTAHRDRGQRPSKEPLEMPARRKPANSDVTDAVAAALSAIEQGQGASGLMADLAAVTVADLATRQADSFVSGSPVDDEIVQRLVRHCGLLELLTLVACGLVSHEPDIVAIVEQVIETKSRYDLVGALEACRGPLPTAVQQRLALRLEPAELRRLGAQLTSQEARVALVRRALPAQPPTRPKRDQERVTAYDFLAVVGDVALLDDDDAGFLDLAMRRLEKHPGTPYTTIVAGMWGDAAAGYPDIAREILFGRSNTAHVLASQRHWALPQVLANLDLTADEARAVLLDLNYAPAGEMTSDVVDTVVALRLPETRLVLRLLAALPHDDPCRRRYEKVLAAACASCPEVTRSRISTHLGAGHKMEGIDPLTASVAELFEWLTGNRLRSDQVLSLLTRTDVDGETAWLAVEASRLVEAVNGTTESRAAAMIDVRPRDEEFVRRVLAHLPNAATRVSRPVKREVLVQALRERLAALTDPAVARHDDYRVTGLSHNLSPLVGADGVWQLPLLPLLAWARHDALVGRWVGERLQNMFETSDRLALFEKVVGRVNESSSTAPAADLLDVVVAAYA